MSHSCAQWRGEIGAYVVGALDDFARDRVSRHLAACAGCRADYDELVPVRTLLGLLAVSAWLDPAPITGTGSAIGQAERPSGGARRDRGSVGRRHIRIIGQPHERWCGSS